jgi:dihydroorotase
MLGLEHAASLTGEALGGTTADPKRFFQLLSRGPAFIAQLRHDDVRVRHTGHGGALLRGEDANVVVFDPHASWTVDRRTLASKSLNTPYDGRTLHGRVRATIAKGRLVVNDGTLT